MSESAREFAHHSTNAMTLGGSLAVIASGTALAICGMAVAVMGFVVNCLINLDRIEANLRRLWGYFHKPRST